MVLKLDLSKAYDHLEWSFIQDTLEDAGLPPNIVAVIIKRVTSGDCRILWNGKTTGPIQPSRGIRQGDPLSPYLFVLCTERLAQWIEREKESNIWRLLKASRDGPKFSHLYFTDDVFLFS